MKKGWKITLIILAALLVLVLVGPFLVPVLCRSAYAHSWQS